MDPEVLEVVDNDSDDILLEWSFELERVVLNHDLQALSGHRIGHGSCGIHSGRGWNHLARRGGTRETWNHDEHPVGVENHFD